MRRNDSNPAEVTHKIDFLCPHVFWHEDIFSEVTHIAQH